MATRSYVDIGALQRPGSGSASPRRSYVDIGAAQRQETTITGQVAHPISDVATGTWTPSSGGNLYAMLDEASADDADYITSASNPAADTAIVQLTSLTQPVNGTVTIYIRAKKI